MFAIILGIVAAAVSGIVGKYLGAEAGLAAGGLVTTAGGRVLHKMQPPAKKAP